MRSPRACASSRSSGSTANTATRCSRCRQSPLKDSGPGFKNDYLEACLLGTAVYGQQNGRQDCDVSRAPRRIPPFTRHDGVVARQPSERMGAPVPAPVDLRYRAFLSYAHADARWAKWLHGQLEAFRIDKDLASRATPRGPVPPTLR